MDCLQTSRVFITPRACPVPRPESPYMWESCRAYIMYILLVVRACSFHPIDDPRKDGLLWTVTIHDILCIHASLF